MSFSVRTALRRDNRPSAPGFFLSIDIEDFEKDKRTAFRRGNRPSAPGIFFSIHIEDWIVLFEKDKRTNS